MAKNQNAAVASAVKKTEPDAKKEALSTALAQIEKQFGKGAIMKLGDSAALQVEAISTGSLGLDLALGVGGVPRGRIIEIYGPESSGKTTLGRALAAALGRSFVDLDEEIVRAAGRSIPAIFEAEGEEGFRARETEQIRRFGKESGLLISCGGGAVKRPENVRALRQNGLVLFIDRPLEALTVGGGRPLSSSPEALRKMEAERRPLYERAADAAVPNDGTVEQAAARALETLNKLFAQ